MTSLSPTRQVPNTSYFPVARKDGNSFDQNMEIKNFISRRQVLRGAALATLSSSFLSSANAQPGNSTNQVRLQKDMTILFQGDSITDAGRQNRQQPNSNEQASMGNGYASMAAAVLLASRSELNLSIYNRGISGNKVHQLASRWQKECLDYQPDVLSILIGVNDIWHGLNGKYDGTVQNYEDDYRSLIQRTRKALPKVQLVICEPFVLRCGAVNDKWFPEFDRYRESARKIANENGAVFVPFQSMFNRAIEFAPPAHWAGDGVHPSPHGAALMADFWLQAVRG
jgi:lysophospholipase L1-like esterase